MAANKVVYGNRTLIDLTGDTVTEEALIHGYTAHKADGTVITGTAFAGYPDEWVFTDPLEDSDGNAIYDNSSDEISGRTVYLKV
ncbi:histidine kinase [Lachnospiraceae bacterium 210521-DFI.3.101]|nr:histidine kinase [Lachnospiraceae bacterium 210521-DFI.3.101]